MTSTPLPARVPSDDGVTLAVHDFGGEGPDLLLVHATGFHGFVWLPLAVHLADRFHAVAPDLRGHGDATVPADHRFEWEGFATDVLAIVDACRFGVPIFAAGHSKGGAALLLAEQRRPGTFRSLFLYEPVVFPFDPPPGPLDDDRMPLVAGALRRRRDFPSREEALANYATKAPFDVLRPDALRAYVDHGFVDEPDGSVSLKLTPEQEAQVYRMGSAHTAWRDLPQVRCPVVVACGEQTDAIKPSHAALLAERLPHGRAEVFEGLGHFGPLEDPARVAAAIAAAFS